MIRKFTLLFALVFLLFPSLSYSQFGFLWNSPKSLEPDNYTNNQYECPVFDLHKSLFDVTELRDKKSEIKAHAIIVRDFNDDGFCDVFVAFAYPYENAEADMLPYVDSFTPYLLLLLDPISGELVDSSYLIDNNIGQPMARKVIAGDLNNDGIMDFAIVGNHTRNEVFLSYLDVVLSSDSGWIQENLVTAENIADHTDLEKNGYFHGLAMGDVNNDGTLDLVLSNWGNVLGLVTFLNDGSGNFTYFYSITNPNIETRMSFNNELFDINSDGCLDTIMSGDVEAGTLILYGLCSGYFGDTFTKLNVKSEQKYNSIFQHFVFTDLNEDGLSDLVAAVSAINYDSWRYIFFENQGVEDGYVTFVEVSDRINPNLIEQGFYQEPHSGVWIDFFSMIDINNDGIKDILVNDFFDMTGEYFNHYEYDTALPLLISDGYGMYHYAKYPISKEVKQIANYLVNDTLHIDFDIEMLVDARFHDTNKFETTNHRGSIVDWILYMSDEPFNFRDERGVIRVTPDFYQRSMDQPHFLKSITLKADTFFADTTYYRIAYIDNFGVEFPLSNLFVFKDEQSTDIENEIYKLPKSVIIHQNYPNPFNPTTQIRFALPESQQVTIRVYDVNGRMVSVLVNNQTYSAGNHQVSFDGTGLSTGVYIYNLTTNSGFTMSRKLVLIK